MIYAIVGERNKGKEKMRGIVKILRDKQMDAEVISLNEENWSESYLDELIVGQGLFSAKSILVLDEVLREEVVREVVAKRMSEIAESPNAFVFYEEKLNALWDKLFKKHATKIIEVLEKKAVEQKSFALAEALGERDKLKMWKLFQAELDVMEAEQIHGGLFWQMKSIVLAHKAKNAEEAGMKGFPWNKAKSFAKNYTKEEAEELLYKLVKVYHEAHRGGTELSLAMEKLMLKI